MSKFKVGDLIRIYSETDVYEDIITKILPGNLIQIQSCRLFHAKQCRKLVKKERRRLWMNEYLVSEGSFPFRGGTYTSQELAKEYALNSCIGQVEFVEVRRKK